MAGGSHPGALAATDRPDFTLRPDGLAWMFAGLVLGIGALVVLYARYYLSQQDNAHRFYCYLLLFMGAMLGMVLSGNLLLLMIFWEMTSISSFLLIGFWSHRRDAREGARMALVITGGGGLALLGGVLLIGRIVGSFDWMWCWPPASRSAPARCTRTPCSGTGRHLHQERAVPVPLLAAARDGGADPGLGVPALGHHGKGRRVPAGAAASGTGRQRPVLLYGQRHRRADPADRCRNAIFQHDLKGLLAYSTISHLGLITLLFGLSTPMAVVAGVFHILNHATFKASLFMAAGIIDHETGTRDMRKLGGLRRLMPFTSALAIIASLAMAGIPLLNGFLSKEMLFAEAITAGGPGIMRTAVSIAALLAGVFGVAYSLRFVHDTFFGPGPHDWIACRMSRRAG